MGVYYFLINKTKGERIEVDAHIKRGPMRFNSGVHFALINYMMDNLGDEFTLLSDDSDNVYGYKEVDLVKHNFEDGSFSDEEFQKTLNERLYS